jgi:hypothetical protein
MADAAVAVPSILSVFVAPVSIDRMSPLLTLPVRSSFPPPFAVIVLPMLLDPVASDRFAATVPTPVRRPFCVVPSMPKVTPEASVSPVPLASVTLPPPPRVSVPVWILRVPVLLIVSVLLGSSQNCWYLRR